MRGKIAQKLHKISEKLRIKQKKMKKKLCKFIKNVMFESI